MADEHRINKGTKTPRGGRIEANWSRIKTDTLKRTPWIDFLAAGVMGPAGQRVGWVAFIHTAPELVKVALSGQSRPNSAAWSFVRSERARTVNKILFKIEESIHAGEPRMLCEPPSNISAICSEYFQKALASREEGTAGMIAPESLIITWGSPPEAPPMSKKRVTAFHFADFAEMLEFVFAPLRLHYGSGWLTNSATFLESLTAEDQSGGMIKASPAHVDYSPAAIAALATARLVAFGWLPMHMNCRAVTLGDAIKDPLSKKAKYLRKLFDQGLRVFEVPRVPMNNMKSLNVADPSQVADARRFHFTSRHHHDKALLAIEFTGYGKRRTSTDMAPPDEAEPSANEVGAKYFLFRLPLNAISVLQTLLPWARTTVISYSYAVSATGRAGILHRMVRHYCMHRDAAGIKDQIIQQIRTLTYPSILVHTIELPGHRRIRGTTNLDLCQYMEMLDAESANDPSISACEDNGASPSLAEAAISSICSLAETSATKDAPPRDEVCRLLPSLLPISPESAAVFSDSSTITTPAASKKELAKLDRDVRDHAAETEEIGLSRASHFRPLTLFRSLLRLFHGVKNLVLSVPEFLQQWIGSMIRLVWVVPLEPMGPFHSCMATAGDQDSIPIVGDPSCSGSEPKFYRSTYVGSSISPRFYPLLFSPNMSEAACQVDIEPLLNFALQGIEAGSNPIWLMNRIGQAEKLMEELKGRFGYVPDFEPSLNHGSLDPRMRLLVSQASETIIRCILMQEDGKRLLDDWSFELMQRVRQVLHGGIPDRYGNTTDENGQRNLAGLYQELSHAFEQLRVFQDSSGIAVAALDCSRNAIMNSARNNRVENALRPLCFRTEKLTRYFRPRIRNTSPGSMERFDDADEKEGALEDDVIRDFDALIIRCFTGVSFSVDRAAALVKIWHNNEGLMRDETPEELFEELADEMYDGRPPADFIEKRNAILNALARL